MAQRRAPEGGYDFAQKQQYRRFVWNSFREQLAADGRTAAGTILKCVGVKRAKALLMPSTEAIEIEVALAKGFRVGNLYSVDDRVGIAADIRKRYPGLGYSFGCDVATACRRAAKDGVKFDAINLDFTGCIGNRLIEQLARVLVSGAMAQRCLLGVTLLRGREQGLADALLWNGGLPVIREDLGKYMRQLGPLPLLQTDWGRIFTVLRMMCQTGASVDVTPVRCGAYRSGPSTMLWFTAIVTRGDAEATELYRKAMHYDSENLLFGPRERAHA